jgi:hypothetical protein
VQMNRILNDWSSHAGVGGSIAGIANGEDRVVDGGGDVQNVFFFIERDARGSDDERCRIAAMAVARGNLSGLFDDDIVSGTLCGDSQIETRDSSAGGVGDKNLRVAAVLFDREIPRPVEKSRSRECFYEASVFVDYEQAALADVLLSAMHIPVPSRLGRFPTSTKPGLRMPSAVVRPRPCGP